MTATSVQPLTVKTLAVRPVSIPLKHPLQTASGELPDAPLVLVDLTTEEGVVGRSYVLSYTPLALHPLARMIRNLDELLAGRAVAPVELSATIAGKFRLLGLKGLPTMAQSAVDMAAWDALGKAADLPVVRLLGGTPRLLPAYGSLKAMRPADAAAEVGDLAKHGFAAYKGRVGFADVDADREVVRAIRDTAGTGTRIAVDYNQSLTVPEADERLSRLADEQLLWAEEPLDANDFAGHERLRKRAPMPLQLGENWWDTAEMATSLQAGASDFAMIDVMRIGGVTGWLRAAGLADAARLPLSSHLFPEVSAHLLAVSRTSHWLEFLDLAGPVLQNPVEPRDGHYPVPETPGFGLDWDEDAVRRYSAD